MRIEVRAGFRSQNPPTIPYWARWILIIASLLMAFDFKGAQEGGIYQRASYFMSLSLICLGILPYLYKKTIYPSRATQISSSLLLTFIIASLLSATTHNYDFKNYIIVAAPYLIMSASFIFLGALCRRHGVNKVAEYFLPLVATASLISCIWQVFYGATAFGGGLAGLRYRIISPLLPFALSIFFAMYYVGTKKITSLLVLAMLLLIILVSQTRSYIVTLAAVILLVTYGNSKSQIEFTKKTIIISSTSFIILFLLYISEGIGSQIINMWATRILGSSSEFGFDITTASRLAEYHSQMTCLFSSTMNMVLGCGIGAPYDYSGYYADFIRDIFGEKGVVQGYWNGGHSLWIYTLYSSGLIFGLAMNLFFIFCCFSALIVVHRYRKASFNEKRLPIMAGTALIAIFSTGFTGFPLGTRSAAFFMGCLMAITIAYVKLRKAS